MANRDRTARQVAALPFIVTRDGVEVLLITSRRRRRWIVPKGWQEAGQTLAGAACREAYEEAGVEGATRDEPLGSYGYRKMHAEGGESWLNVTLYPLLVTVQKLDWPERAERIIAWHAIGAAAELVDDPALARLMRRLARNDGERLRALAERSGGFAAPVSVPA